MSQYKCSSNDGTDQYTGLSASVCACGQACMRVCEWVTVCFQINPVPQTDRGQGDKGGLILSPVKPPPRHSGMYQKTPSKWKRIQMFCPISAFRSKISVYFILLSGQTAFLIMLDRVTLSFIMYLEFHYVNLFSETGLNNGEKKDFYDIKDRLD